MEDKVLLEGVELMLELTEFIPKYDQFNTFSRDQIQDIFTKIQIYCDKYLQSKDIHFFIEFIMSQFPELKDNVTHTENIPILIQIRRDLRIKSLEND
jgi:hypothetical protein